MLQILPRERKNGKKHARKPLAREIEDIKRLLEEAGLEFIAVYDAYTKEPATEESEKVLFVAREHGKTI